jgi:cell division protein FtsB
MNQSTHLPAAEQRRRWRLSYVLVTLVVAMLLFFAGVGVIWMVGRHHPISTPAPSDGVVEESGVAPWLPSERRAELKRRVDRIDRDIPAIEGELKYLDEAMQREKARVQQHQESKIYIDFILREQNFLRARIDDLRSDRAFLHSRAAREIG